MLGETMDNFGWTLSDEDIRKIRLNISVMTKEPIKEEDVFNAICDKTVKDVKRELDLAKREHRYKNEIRRGDDMPPSVEIAYRCVMKNLNFTEQEANDRILYLRKGYRSFEHHIPYIAFILLLIALFPTFLWFGSDCCWNTQGMLLWWVILPGPFFIFYFHEVGTCIDKEDTTWYNCDTGEVVKKDEVKQERQFV